MDEIQVNELADQVAAILNERNDTVNSVLVVVGEVALLLGTGYVVARLVKNLQTRRQVRKAKK